MTASGDTKVLGSTDYEPHWLEVPPVESYARSEALKCDIAAAIRKRRASGKTT